MGAFSIFVVSGGAGTSGTRVVQTALAQFEGVNAPVTVFADVQDAGRLDAIVEQAADERALIVHTLVNSDVRDNLSERARRLGVPAVDIMGPLLGQLARYFGQTPLGQPGRYRRLREQDVRRIEAIEFSVDHDDGKRAGELRLAEIVLAGVSRVGKTPLSMYLSTLGWKVANVPLIKGVEPPDSLFAVDSRRVVGLTVEPGQLVAYRRRRQRNLGLSGGMAYSAPDALADELDFARAVFRQGGFAIVDMTDKPVEEAADEVVAVVTRRLK